MQTRALCLTENEITLIIPTLVIVLHFARLLKGPQWETIKIFVLYLFSCRIMDPDADAEWNSLME
jgi:hypothetical protein